LPSLIRMQYSEGYLFFASLLITLGIALFMILPPSILRGPRYERLAPLLVWICTCSIQIVLVTLLKSKKEIAETGRKIHQGIQRIKSDDLIGVSILLISFFLSLIILYFTFYNAGDEGETFVNGWLLSNGQVLYRDVFTNHFPLSYIWVSIITTLFGSSVAIYRLSLLFLRIVLFGSAMAITRDKLVIGLVSLFWSLIGPLYLGNLLVYYSFNCILITSAFFIVFAVLKGEIKLSPTIGLYTGFLVGLSFLNDPFMYLPGVIILFFLFYAGFCSGVGIKGNLLRSLSPILSAITLLAIYAAYLLLTSSFNEFIQQSILFNIQIYSKYSNVYPTITPFFRAIFSGFDVFSSSVRLITDPYYDFQYFELLEGWIYTALLFRLAVITFVLTFILRKKYICAIFIYILGAGIYARGANYFHSSAFILYSIIAAAFILQDFFTTFFEIWTVKPSKNCIHFYKLLIFIILAGSISSMLMWLDYRVSGYLVQKRSELSYEDQFGHYINDANHYYAFSCGNDKATFLYYPYNPIISYLTLLPPTTRYYNMAPWVAEVGLQETIENLDGKYAIVYVDKDNYLWGFNTNEYLSDLISYLDNNYIEVEYKTYLSPLQYQYCYSSQGQ